MSDLYKPKELAIMLRMGIRSVYKHLNKGKIKGHKIGGSWRISKKEVERLTGDNGKDENGS